MEFGIEKIRYLSKHHKFLGFLDYRRFKISIFVVTGYLVY